MKYDKGYDTYVVDGRYKAFKKSIPKARKPVRRVSKKRASEARIYAQRKSIFLANRTLCVRCLNWILPPNRDLHHWASRAGKLFLEESLWIMLCRGCHQWVHEHPEAARKEGLLAPKGCWNDYKRAMEARPQVE